MGVETTISLSLIFSSISMIGVLANIYISFKRESESNKLKEVQIEKHFAQIDVKLENFFSTMTEIVRKNETCTQKIDENLKASTSNKIIKPKTTINEIIGKGFFSNFFIIVKPVFTIKNATALLIPANAY